MGHVESSVSDYAFFLNESLVDGREGVARCGFKFKVQFD